MIEAARVQRLELPAGRVRVVVDTDAANEIDDQFALAYAVLSPERLTVEAAYAAPFQRPGKADPGSPGFTVSAMEGMRQSYEEIMRVLGALGSTDIAGRVHRGAESWLPDAGTA